MIVSVKGRRRDGQSEKTDSHLGDGNAAVPGRGGAIPRVETIGESECLTSCSLPAMWML
jgi:hypothetical protein